METETYKLNLLSITDIYNFFNKSSFELKNIEYLKEDCPLNEIKIAYLRKDDIPTIEILNQNLMLYDEQEYEINNYIEQIKAHITKVKDINNNSNDLLDDYKYELCKICKNNFNCYFCKSCNKNICDVC